MDQYAKISDRRKINICILQWGMKQRFILPLLVIIWKALEMRSTEHIYMENRNGYIIIICHKMPQIV